MAISGADVDQLDALARTLAKAGDSFGQSYGQIRDSLYRANWTGPSADRFRSEWTSHGKGLSEAQDALHELASRLRKEADQQRVASGVDGRLPSGTSRTRGLPLAWLQDLPGFASPSSPGSFTISPGQSRSWDIQSMLTPFEAEIPRVMSGVSSVDDLKPNASRLLNQLDSRLADTGASFDSSKEWSFQKAGEAPWGSYSVDAQAGIGVEGSFNATAGIRDGQLQGDFTAGLRMGAYAEVAANTNLFGFVPAGVHAEAMAGAEADITGAMALGANGVHGNISGGAFAGARAGADGELNLGGYGDAKAGGEAWAGVGVEGSGEGDLNWDRVGLKADFGIGLGVGAKLSFDVGFSPKGLFNGISDFGGNLSEVGVNDVARAFANTPVVGDIADKAVSTAAGAIAGAGRSAFKAVGGLFGW